MAEANRHALPYRFDLIVPEFLEALAVVLSEGANKYGENNYQKGLPGAKSAINHALYHINAYQQCEPNGDKSTTSHLIHAAANLMMEYWLAMHPTPEEKQL